MPYPLHIVHPIGGKNLTPVAVMSILKHLHGKILAVKLHPAFIIFMQIKFGFDVIKTVKEAGFLVMIDDKSHDIRVEVASFVEMYEEAGADILTIHASGGPRMLADAVAAAQKVKIFGVTLLTSLDDWECNEVYVTDPQPTVVRLMQHVEDAECHGSVCAPRDLKWIAEADIDVGARDRLCPNIRDPEVPIKGDDQNLNRSLTPSEAGAGHVTLMVIGRMLKDATNPGVMAELIEAEFIEGRQAA